MKNLLWNRIPSTCICFTLIVLANWGLDLLWGNEVSPSCWFCLCGLLHASL